MNKCYECETIEDLQEHHVVPRSRGGTKTMTLGYECHLKVHGRDGKGINHSRLVKEGLQRARESRGVKLGTDIPKVKAACEKATRERGAATLQRLAPHIKAALEEGNHSLREISNYLNHNDILTARNKTWTKANLSPVLKRLREQQINLTQENK